MLARTNRRRNHEVRRISLWIAPGVLLAILAAIATGYRVQLLPPSLTSDSAQYAAATTQVLVDFPQESVLLSTQYPIEPLADRASVYARLAASPTIRDRIGKESGIDPVAIDISGPYNPNAERLLREPTEERRAAQLEAEGKTYRLRFDTESSQAVPLVLIYAQAPTVAEAERLADAGATGLSDYLKSVQQGEGLESNDRLKVKPLGEATGGIVNPGVDREIAILVFAATLLGWVLLILVSRRILEFLRTQVEPSPGGRRGADHSRHRSSPELDAPASSGSRR